MILSESERRFMEDVLETALRELEGLEEELDWYTSKVPEQLEEALELIRGYPSEQ